MEKIENKKKIIIISIAVTLILAIAISFGYFFFIVFSITKNIIFTNSLIFNLNINNFINKYNCK